MSKVDVVKRFASVMGNRSKLLSVSLPMVCGETEVLFFYYADSKDGSFTLRNLDNVAVRQGATVTLKPSTDWILPQHQQTLIGCPQPTGPTGESALALLDAYYTIHEEVLAGGDRADRDLLLCYLHAFEALVPKGNLHKVYLVIGRPMFDVIATRTGCRLGP